MRPVFSAGSLQWEDNRSGFGQLGCTLYPRASLPFAMGSHALTELVFKGKEFVYNHHLAVPFRPLEPHADKSIGEPRLDGNLIIHGDNLHALKALLPMYAGRVDCIFIDPPYNTGNEGPDKKGWNYSDNVSAPFIKEWLNGNPIGVEDGLRHDKWCAMMYPRLRLLHELLADTGSFWVTLDDNEIHRARSILDEIFGKQNFVTCIAWQKIYTVKNSASYFSSMHDYVLVYAKRKDAWVLNLIPRDEESDYSNPDNDQRGDWTTNAVQARNPYSEGLYEITGPTGTKFKPPAGTYWRVSESTFKNLDRDKRIWWGQSGDSVPRIKKFLSETKDGIVPATMWFHQESGTNGSAKEKLRQIFHDASDVFVTPKPVELINRILSIATKPNSLVLDSFAGSGTTAHAVLAQNKKDGGNRKFILVEGEDYADTLTAERVRRVIDGYAFEGTQKEELLREKITWSKFSRDNAHQKILDQVASFENLDSGRFDAIKKTIDDGELIVTGETRVTEKVEGLGGNFTYCTLGAPIELDALLTGKSLPSFKALAAVLFHMATNTPFEASAVPVDARGVGRLGEAAGLCVWLIYKPDLAWLKSKDAALTLEQARKIAQVEPDTSHLVFAPARFVSQKLLNAEGLKVEFAPLPYALYKIERG